MPELTCSSAFDQALVDEPSWHALRHNGNSSAKIFRIDSGPLRDTIIKKVSFDGDWMSVYTKDQNCREYQFSCFDPRAGAFSPSIGSIKSGDSFYVAMRDVSDSIIGNRNITPDELNAIIKRILEVHRFNGLLDAAISWCAVELRLSLMLYPTTLPTLPTDPLVWDMVRTGWEMFMKVVPFDIRELIKFLGRNLHVLVTAMQRLPKCLVHGDVKLDNIAIDKSGEVLFIDWSFVLLGSPAIDLGWFLGREELRIPTSLDAVIENYARQAGQDVGLLRPLVAISGLVMQGWRKGVESYDGRPIDLDWWIDQARVARRAFCLE